ncbi:MAG: hypothetical protein BroJett011_16150 [Chloroflexota bacterium]|nr:MAG: hypothetical protein BroJett011_16150 [Chloroflexota bacterium]
MSFRATIGARNPSKRLRQDKVLGISPSAPVEMTWLGLMKLNGKDKQLWN